MKKIVFISDTHQFRPDIPEGDILVHAGDYSSGRGNKDALRELLEWFSTLEEKFETIIFIAGNHDFYAELEPEGTKRLVDQTNFIYLNDSGVEVDGIKFWGSPISPEFGHWAFNRRRGEQIQKHWDLIPKDTDVLITHGPPYGILDVCARYADDPHQGCQNLLHDVIERVKPKIHVFGHIHEAYGTAEVKGTQFINASLCTLFYVPSNKPVVVEYDNGNVKIISD